MKTTIQTITTSLAALALAGTILLSGCANSSQSAATPNVSGKNNGETKPPAPGATSADSPSGVVKAIYDNALKRNCAAIPTMLTEEFKKAVGTSRDELDALCDSFTDSGKLVSYEIKGEEIKGETAVVKVALTFKDGKKQEKEERVKKSGGKWSMDS